MNPMRTFDSRINMLSLVKKGGNICELGALKGDFSEIILALCKPNQLVLVDIWPKEVVSGDVNGNNLEKFDGDYLYEFVEKRFKHAPAVKIIRKLTVKALKKFPDNYFDMIYIDADHRYEAVAEDLKWAYKKVKRNGFIMGHDYEINSAKTAENYQFGVKQAVDEFCLNNGQAIYAKAKDGCVSYAIKVAK